LRTGQGGKTHKFGQNDMSSPWTCGATPLPGSRASKLQGPAWVPRTALPPSLCRLAATRRRLRCGEIPHPLPVAHPSRRRDTGNGCTFWAQRHRQRCGLGDECRNHVRIARCTSIGMPPRTPNCAISAARDRPHLPHRCRQGGTNYANGALFQERDYAIAAAGALPLRPRRPAPPPCRPAPSPHVPVAGAAVVRSGTRCRQRILHRDAAPATGAQFGRSDSGNGCGLPGGEGARGDWGGLAVAEH
jgi:hypothetical protein